MLNRRELLKIGTFGLCGMTLPELLRLEAQTPTMAKKGGKAKSVIMLWLHGGPPTKDMWDMKLDAPAEIRGELGAIDSSLKGLKVCDLLPLSAKIMDKVTLVRSCNHLDNNHGQGSQWVATGNQPTKTIVYPSLGAIAGKLLPSSGVPSYVLWGEDQRGRGAHLAGRLGPTWNPFMANEGTGAPGKKKRLENKPVDAAARKKREEEIKKLDAQLRVAKTREERDKLKKALDDLRRGEPLFKEGPPASLTLDDLADRDHLMKSFDSGFRAMDQDAELAESFDEFHVKALDILRSDKTKTAFDMSLETEELREAYGTSGVGRGALLARRLIEAGTRFVTVIHREWDIHGNHYPRLRKVLPELDQAMSALITDLEDRGMLDETVVYVVGEFGRTPKLNKSGGSDHWSRTMCPLLAGGGFQRGLIYGKTDDQCADVEDDPCSPDDLGATLFHALGVSAQQLAGVGGRQGAFPRGKAIDALLA